MRMHQSHLKKNPVVHTRCDVEGGGAAECQREGGRAGLQQQPRHRHRTGTGRRCGVVQRRLDRQLDVKTKPLKAISRYRQDGPK